MPVPLYLKISSICLAIGMNLAVMSNIAYAKEEPAKSQLELPVDAAPIIFMTKSGQHKFKVEIAATPNQRAKGLMNRLNFPHDRAMLFVFPYKQIITMWMVDTPLALDMVFIDADGKIVNITEDAKPYSRQIISSANLARFAVELNAGVVHAKQISIGQYVNHPLINK